MKLIVALVALILGTSPARGSVRAKALRHNASKPCASPRCSGVVDAMILLDVSGSVGDDGVKQMRKFASNLVDHFEFGNGPDSGQQLGFISFGRQSKILSGLSTDKAALKSAANKLEMQPTAGNLATAFSLGISALRYGRPEAFWAMVVVTDDPSTQSAQAEMMAKRASEAGIMLYAVVIEDYHGDAHLAAQNWLAAAGQYPVSDHLVSVQSCEELDTEMTKGTLVYMICPESLNVVSSASVEPKQLRQVVQNATTR